MLKRIVKVVAVAVLILTAAAVSFITGGWAALPTGAPKVGDAPPALPPDSAIAKSLNLEELNKLGPVVLVQLRGWVGYQCPICNQQVGDLISHAPEFKAKAATVVLLYPGDGNGLDEHAKAFMTGKDLPENFHLVLDPGLAFVKTWGLRWNWWMESAYPATFVVDKSGKITYAKVSHSHGDRASAAEVLAALK